jgi:hypothetical protein
MYTVGAGRDRNIDPVVDEKFCPVFSGNLRDIARQLK